MSQVLFDGSDAFDEGRVAFLRARREARQKARASGRISSRIGDVSGPFTPEELAEYDKADVDDKLFCGGCRREPGTLGDLD